ncbi:MAG: hypothetical protein LBI02_02020 [Opitutaceae bacterium]|jgi:hypothetical protein|nr:hypothetical protein [Opitutaceae bacterium]
MGKSVNNGTTARAGSTPEGNRARQRVNYKPRLRPAFLVLVIVIFLRSSFSFFVLVLVLVLVLRFRSAFFVFHFSFFIPRFPFSILHLPFASGRCRWEDKEKDKEKEERGKILGREASLWVASAGKCREAASV